MNVDRFEVVILMGDRALVPVCGTPLLEHQLDLCRRNGFSNVLLLHPPESAAFAASLGNGSRFGLTLACQVESPSRGSAGTIRDTSSHLADTFLVLDGNRYMDLDLRRLWRAHQTGTSDATLLVRPSDRPDDSNLVSLDSEGAIRSIRPAGRPPTDEYRNLTVDTCWVLARPVIERFVPSRGNIDLIQDTLPLLLAKGARLLGHRSPEYVRNVISPEQIERVERDLERGVAERLSGRQGRGAVFLDRDGTINRDVGLLSDPDRLELVAGAAGAIRRLNETGRLAVVITNQSVVARGGVTPDGLERIHARLDRLLGQHGAYLDGLYACPHHPDRGSPGEVAELKVACHCRKPATGSIDSACRDLGIDLADSWFVGDTTRDVETGRRAGVKTVLVRTGHAGRDGFFPFEPDYVVPDLDAAVSWILDLHPILERRILPVVDAAFRARLVIIGGQAQAGKSSAAQALRETMEAMGRPAHVLSLDSWLKPAGAVDDAGVTTRYDIQGLTAAIGSLARAHEPRSIELPVYDRASRTMYEHPRRLDIRPTDLLIAEGIPALLFDDLCRLAEVRVHVEAPDAERRTRMQAESGWRRASAADSDALVASWEAQNAGPVEAARVRADLVVTTSAIAPVTSQ